MNRISPGNLILLPALALSLLLSSCSDSPEILAEGIILYVEYEKRDGRTGGFTRLNIPEAVPGGNGSWNIDAYGKLTENYLIITRPQKRDLGELVIPASRLVTLQFGDGGIPTVEENKPNPANRAVARILSFLP